MIYKKYRIIYLVLLATCYSTTAFSDVFTTLKHPEYNQTLTIIAELGLGDKSMKKISPELNNKIINASKILIETEQGNTEIQKIFNSIVLNGYPNQLKEQTNKETWEHLNQWLNNKKQEPGSHLVTSVPSHWSLILIGNINLRKKTQYTISRYLSLISPKIPTAIFKAEEQHEWFMAFDKKAINSLIDQSLNENNQYYNQLIKSWKKNDSKKLKTIVNGITTQKSGEYIQHNYDVLNEKIAQRLQLLGKGDHVVAINIISFMGKNNVLDRLLESGYQIEKKQNNLRNGV